MTWTTTQPDREGWYWMQQDSEYPECVEIFIHIDDGLCVASHGRPVRTIAHHHEMMKMQGHKIKWSTEPILEPREPTERDERETRP